MGKNKTRYITRSSSALKRTWRGALRFSDSTVLKVFVSIAIVVLGVAYVGKTNTASTKGYVIADLETEIRELQRENQQLSVSVAKFSSMQNVRQRIARLGMAQADDVEYIKPVGSAVAFQQ